jgi:hypothetical protein
MNKARKSPSSIFREEDKGDDPHLCVDFALKDGFIFLIIKNLSAFAATHVRITFSQDIHILGGSKSLADLSIFSKLSYLAPWKEIEVYLDTAELFLPQFRDTVVVVSMTYASEKGRNLKKSIAHDLAIYRDLPIFLNPHQNG